MEVSSGSQQMKSSEEETMESQQRKPSEEFISSNRGQQWKSAEEVRKESNQGKALDEYNRTHRRKSEVNRGKQQWKSAVEDSSSEVSRGSP